MHPHLFMTSMAAWIDGGFDAWHGHYELQLIKFIRWTLLWINVWDAGIKQYQIHQNGIYHGLLALILGNNNGISQLELVMWVSVNIFNIF